MNRQTNQRTSQFAYPHTSPSTNLSPKPARRLPKRLVATALCAACWLPVQLGAQPIPGTPGTPATPAPVRQGGGGFGFSFDLGSVLKAVQAVQAVQAAVADERYSSPDPSNLNRYEPRQVILSWADAQQNQAAAAVQSAGGFLLANAALTNLGLNIVVLSFDTDAQAASALIRLQSTPGITADRHAIAYPMQQAAAAAAPPIPARHYAHELLKAPPKGSGKLGASITVGIIDTEVTNADALAVGNFKSKRMFADTDKPAPADHGNAVASIVAASGQGFEGLAQGVALRAAGVMREVAPGINATNTLLVAQALDWMVGEKVQVVNLSLGSASDAVLSTVITKSLGTGMVLVAAAGNGGPTAAPSYPAAYPGVIAVTAVDAKKRLYARANRGDYVAIAAPGVDVWVPLAANDSKGRYMSGTSFASPFVAAAVAQVVAQGAASQPKTATPASAQVILQTLCSKAADIGPKGPEVGCGLLQM